MNSFTVLLKAVPARIFVFILFHFLLHCTYATNTNRKQNPPITRVLFNDGFTIKQAA